MLNTTDEFDDAVDSPVQKIKSELFVDWDNANDPVLVDHSSVSVERSLVSTLPEAVRAVEGSASAQLSADLVTPPTYSGFSAAQYYSRLSTGSPLYGKGRIRVPVDWYLTYDTDQGPEFVKRFTGFSRVLNVQSSSDSASLQALDYREKLRAKISLPNIVATLAGDEIPLEIPWITDAKQRPGLNAQWITDFVLGQNGIYNSPPPLNKCVVRASLLGSAWADVGKFAFSYGNGFDTRIPGFDQNGVFGYCLDDNGVDPFEPNIYMYYMDQDNPITPAPGSGFKFESWIFCDNTANMNLVEVSNNSLGSDGSSARFELSSGRFRLLISRAGAGVSIINGPFLPATSGQWFYLGAEVRFTAGGENVTFRVDGTSTSASRSASVTTWGAQWTTAMFSSDQPMSSWQVAAVNAGDPVATWNNAFVPTAYLRDDTVFDRPNSTNQLEAILPGGTTDSWALLEELATAEQATFFFDMNGTFIWWTPRHWQTDQAKTVDRVLTTGSSVLDISYEDSIDLVNNRVRVDVTKITVSAPQFVWQTPEVYQILPGTTRTIWANFPSAVVSLDPPELIWGQPFPTDRSYISANIHPEGDASGAVVPVGGIDVSFTPFADAAKISITNHMTIPFYMIGWDSFNNATVNGIKLWGRLVQSDTVNASFVEKFNQLSIDKFGEQPLSVPSTRWIQNFDFADEQATQVLSDLAFPRPVITSVPIIGDPRLELGDRVSLMDPAGNLLPLGDYWVTGITDTISGSEGYTQKLTARRAITPGKWDENQWDLISWA